MYKNRFFDFLTAFYEPEDINNLEQSFLQETFFDPLLFVTFEIGVINFYMQYA
jgi:hypothetical protein